MSMLAAMMVLAGASGSAASSDGLMRNYINCAVSTREPQMRLLLDTKADEDYRAAALSVTDVDKCARSDAAVTAPLLAAFGPERGKFRGMVAETLLKRSTTVRKLATLPQVSSYTAGWFAFTGRPQAVDEMAMCVAATNPGGIITLLGTKPGSPGQRQALTGLTPSLGACLAKGYQLDTKPAGLRAALAEALYHRDFYVAVPGRGS